MSNWWINRSPLIAPIAYATGDAILSSLAGQKPESIGSGSTGVALGSLAGSLAGVAGKRSLGATHALSASGAIIGGWLGDRVGETWGKTKQDLVVQQLLDEHLARIL